MTSYGTRFLAAVERARTITAGTVPVETRQAEIIDLALQGLTVPQMRALYVAYYAGAPLPGSLRRAEVAEALRTAAFATLRPAEATAAELADTPAARAERDHPEPSVKMGGPR